MVSYLYAFGGLIFGALSLIVQNIYFSIFLGWTSLSLLLVCVAYFLDEPRIFKKSDDGAVSNIAQLFLLPFFLGIQLYNAIARNRDTVPPIQKISEDVFLACRLFPSDLDFLQEQGVNAVLDATSEFNGLKWSAKIDHLHYLNIPILDHRAPKDSEVIKAVKWIQHNINSGNRVVIHCALGRGRSVFILAAYLLASRNINNVDEALSLINKTRQTARLNKRQRRALQKIFDSGKLTAREQILLVANPVSGGGKWVEKRSYIEQRLSQRYELIVKETSIDVSAKSITRQHIDKGFKVIVACGGDGTVNEVASELINSDICLGIIPLGTTNALSHVLLGIQTKFTPVSLACDVLIEGNFSQIDTAKCNEDLMLLVAGMGFEQRMITMANRENKDRSGELAYIQALASSISDNQSTQFTIQVDDKEPEIVVASSLVLANAAPFTTLLAQGDGEPNPTDGMLDMTIVDTREHRVIPLASLGFRGLTKHWIDQEHIEGLRHERVKSVRIYADTTLEYVVDGETREANEVKISVLPSSLCVMHTPVNEQD
jgi:diacylglycerol kinase family enzyme